jgi:hypothetical protein
VGNTLFKSANMGIFVIQLLETLLKPLVKRQKHAEFSDNATGTKSVSFKDGIGGVQPCMRIRQPQ